MARRAKNALLVLFTAVIFFTFRYFSVLLILHLNFIFIQKIRLEKTETITV